MKSLRVVLLIVAMLAFSACNETQSVLSPHGRDAERIATLTWILFGMVAAVMVIVLVATWLAIRGSDAWRTRLASERTIIICGVAFPAIVLTALLVYGLLLMRTSQSVSSEAFVIEVRGEQWWWRVRYPLSDGSTFESANEIKLPVGRPVVLQLTSADVIHSIWIPALAGKVDLIPGRTTRLPLQAERAGIYRGACAEYCGGPHALMALHAVALSADEFDQWLNERGASSVPTDQGPQRGRALFQAAGCGGCHAIDGTDARGTIGPSLTDIGARHSIGAGLLTMSRENLSRFIADSQVLKPGNRMPPFRIFDERQLADLSSYLAELR